MIFKVVVVVAALAGVLGVTDAQLLLGGGAGIPGAGVGGRSLILRSRQEGGVNTLAGYILSPQTGDVRIRNSVRGPLGGGVDRIVSSDPAVGLVSRTVVSRPIIGGSRQAIVGTPLGRYELSPFYVVIPGKTGIQSGIFG